MAISLDRKPNKFPNIWGVQSINRRCRRGRANQRFKARGRQRGIEQEAVVLKPDGTLDPSKSLSERRTIGAQFSRRWRGNQPPERPAPGYADRLRATGP